MDVISQISKGLVAAFTFTAIIGIIFLVVVFWLPYVLMPHTKPTTTISIKELELIATDIKFPVYSIDDWPNCKKGDDSNDQYLPDLTTDKNYTEYLKNDLVNGFYYTRSIKTADSFMGGEKFLEDVLYVSKQGGNKKLLFSGGPGHGYISGFDFERDCWGTLNIDGYSDKRGYVYIRDHNNVYVIKNDNVIGKISNINALEIWMFSDSVDTYLLIPKDESVLRSHVQESDIGSKYKIILPE